MIPTYRLYPGNTKAYLVPQTSPETLHCFQNVTGQGVADWSIRLYVSGWVHVS